MNSENQKLIIQIFGACLITTLLGVILMALNGTPLEVITIFTGIFTAIFTALATFLKDKNLSEKESETLEKYFIQNAVKDAEDESIENIIEESESGENAIQ